VGAVENAVVLLREVPAEKHLAQRGQVADVRDRSNNDALGLELASELFERRERIDQMLQNVVADDRVEVVVG